MVLIIARIARPVSIRKVYNKSAPSKIAKGNFFLQKLLAVDLKHEPGDEKNRIRMCK
jgi:hypothetical protein